MTTFRFPLLEKVARRHEDLIRSLQKGQAEINRKLDALIALTERGTRAAVATREDQKAEDTVTRDKRILNLP